MIAPPASEQRKRTQGHGLGERPRKTVENHTLGGVGLSDAGYPIPTLGVEIGTRRLRLTAQAATLEDAVDSAGQAINRYFFHHRVSAAVTRRLELALWETTVLAGPGRSFSDRYRNPVTLLLLANQYGLGADGNILVGGDLTWRVGRGRLLLQLGVDDFQYDPGRIPNRYAFTVQAEGPLGRRLAWRAGYSQASSLAFRTTRPFEGFTEEGVGIGRNYADNDQVTLLLSAPVARGWLIAPELTLLRQGEGRLTDSLPSGAALADTPTLFIGTIERTWRAALGLSGNAWESVFNTKKLNDDFYLELFKWYLHAKDHVTFPNDTNEEADKYLSEWLIRFISRMLFVWFMKEKKLISQDLFDLDKIKSLLNNFDETNNKNTYYKAILQNLFFATLNVPVEERKWIDGKKRNKPQQGDPLIYRFENEFTNSDDAIDNIFMQIPFLNGGLFDGLDDRTNAVFVDGFTP